MMIRKNCRGVEIRDVVHGSQKTWIDKILCNGNHGVFFLHKRMMGLHSLQPFQNLWFPKTHVPHNKASWKKRGKKIRAYT